RRKQTCSNPSAHGSRDSTNVTLDGSPGGTAANPAPGAPALGGIRSPGVLRPVLAGRRHALAGIASAPVAGDPGRGPPAPGPLARGQPDRWFGLPARQFRKTLAAAGGGA